MLGQLLDNTGFAEIALVMEAEVEERVFAEVGAEFVVEFKSTWGDEYIGIDGVYQSLFHYISIISTRFFYYSRS